MVMMMTEVSRRMSQVEGPLPCKALDGQERHISNFLTKQCDDFSLQSHGEKCIDNGHTFVLYFQRENIVRNEVKERG